MDGGQRQNVSVHDTSSLFDASPTRTLNFSTKLTLTKGAHNVKVSLEADSYYVANLIPGTLSSVGVHGDSEPVNFTVTEPEAEPEPFPTTLVAASAATLAVAGAGLLLYFKKRHSKSEDEACGKAEHIDNLISLIRPYG